MDHNLPTNIVIHLAKDLAASTRKKDRIESSEGVESTADVGRLIREGMKAIRYLDAIMGNKYTPLARLEERHAQRACPHPQEKARCPQRRPSPAK